MKLLVNEKPGNEELKCYITLGQTESKYTVGASDPKYAGCGPQIVVTTPAKTESVIFSANAVCRYIALEKNALQVEDLVVDDWLEWESLVLSPWVSKAKKNAGDKKKLTAELAQILSEKEEARASKVEALAFLFGNVLSLADIVVGVTLRSALELVDGDSAILKKFRDYIKQLFQLPAFTKGLATLSPAAAPADTVSKLDKKLMSGVTQHSILSIVESIFDEAIQAAYPGLDNLPAVEVTRTKNPKFGDYQCNSAMAIFTTLKGTPNAAKSPRDVDRNHHDVCGPDRGAAGQPRAGKAQRRRRGLCQRLLDVPVLDGAHPDRAP